MKLQQKHVYIVKDNNIWHDREYIIALLNSLSNIVIKELYVHELLNSAITKNSILVVKTIPNNIEFLKLEQLVLYSKPQILIHLADNNYNNVKNYHKLINIYNLVKLVYRQYKYPIYNLITNNNINILPIGYDTHFQII